MDKKTEILSMVEEIYIQCIIDYLHVIVKDAHQVATNVQDGEHLHVEAPKAEQIP